MMFVRTLLLYLLWAALSAIMLSGVTLVAIGLIAAEDMLQPALIGMGLAFIALFMLFAFRNL